MKKTDTGMESLSSGEEKQDVPDQDKDVGQQEKMRAQETLNFKERLKITRESETLDNSEPYWQYLLVLKALERAKRVRAPEGNAVIDREEEHRSSSAGRQ
ncbi:hypothetical protein BDV34DRAFT_201947 [Aspergillus parasiticus]|uniref:Uncharacterized protein n=1 Tax=Aspergillus parasiticus TaxID=5067 RepID=A0A5N6DC36_ASPPA|nr:hypothetical protein BDV34DRAFT_201947 [Aspergillus parasiticus]